MTTNPTLGTIALFSSHIDQEVWSAQAQPIYLEFRGDGQQAQLRILVQPVNDCVALSIKKGNGEVLLETLILPEQGILVPQTTRQFEPPTQRSFSGLLWQQAVR